MIVKIDIIDIPKKIDLFKESLFKKHQLIKH